MCASDRVIPTLYFMISKRTQNGGSLPLHWGIPLYAEWGLCRMGGGGVPFCSTLYSIMGDSLLAQQGSASPPPPPLPVQIAVPYLYCIQSRLPFYSTDGFYLNNEFSREVNSRYSDEFPRHIRNPVCSGSEDELINCNSDPNYCYIFSSVACIPLNSSLLQPSNVVRLCEA
jgi:hypothetical protein